jgi:hypothetical protein
MDTRIERISCFIGGGFATAMKRHEHVLGVFVGGTERVLGKTPLGDPWRSFRSLSHMLARMEILP